ncbi:MAG: heme-binding protein [Alkalibacterium sp.]|nr:heme-binding protein [Alkalibacterium sp.]
MGKYETPDYEVVTKEKDFELRKYAHFFIVEYENTADPEVNNAFRTLFKYISDDNKENEKISMTVPVIQEATGQNRKMAFVVPEKYEDHIPEPNNPNLKPKKFAEGFFASVTYSGLSNDSKEEKMKKKLNEWVQKKGYEKESHFMVAIYNGPFTLPMLRRNEIWVRVSID